MQIVDFAEMLLNRPSLSDKLFFPETFEDSKLSSQNSPLMPARERTISFSEKQLKFPKKGRLESDLGRGLALHFFANHELIAIEMMASAILKFFNNGSEGKLIARSLLGTIRDEQKHLKLYIARMKELGVEFGEFPLNDFFWRQDSKIKSPHQFFSTMSLTFEAANLDFAIFYRDLFEEIGDKKTSEIMNIIYLDEIGHVAKGVHFLNSWRKNIDLWSYYIEGLPDALGPARAKGKHFDFDGRLRANLDIDFIENIKNYRDNFLVTDRREWKEDGPQS